LLAAQVNDFDSLLVVFATELTVQLGIQVIYLDGVLLVYVSQPTVQLVVQVTYLECPIVRLFDANRWIAGDCAE
jgi:hypothetical protein